MSDLMNQNPVKAAPVATLDTVSKTVIDLLNPREEDIKIEDIANGLSMICRFGGQIDRFYSVAEHSILVSHLCPPELKREALLHDASEAYLGDVIRPLKGLLGLSYKRIEFNFEAVIFQKFGLDFGKLAAVKEYDLQAYELEDEALRQGEPLAFADMLSSFGMVVAGTEVFWRPMVAKLEFMRAFGLLFNDRSKMEG